MIAKALGLPVEEPVETYHTSDHLYTDLGIAHDATGTLPRSKRVLAGLDAEKIEDLGETGRRERGSQGSRRPRGGRGARAGRSGGGRASRSDGHDDHDARWLDGARARRGGTTAHDGRRRSRKRTRGGRPVPPRED